MRAKAQGMAKPPAPMMALSMLQVVAQSPSLPVKRPSGACARPPPVSPSFESHRAGRP